MRSPTLTPKLPKQSYKGYLICTSPFRDDYWIECDGYVIQHSVATSKEAEKLIDNLIEK